MELQVKEYQAPQAIEFNYEELKQEISHKLDVYTSLVYTDEQIKDAKKDRADLNRLKKALNDERLRREREYMAPFDKFKRQVNEIIGIIDKPVMVIDKQIKGYEAAQKAAKEKEIREYMDSLGLPYGIKMDPLFEARWLNATCKIEDVKVKLDAMKESVLADLRTLEGLGEFRNMAIAHYAGTLNLRDALGAVEREKQRREYAAKIEAERKAKEAEKPEPKRPAITPEAIKTVVDAVEEAPRQWVSFSALVTIGEAMELKRFFESRGIEFRRA